LSRSSFPTSLLSLLLNLLFQHSALFPLHAIHLDSILFAITSGSSLIEFPDVRFNRLVLFDCSCSALSPPTFPYPSVLSVCFLFLLSHSIFPIHASVRNIWCLSSLQTWCEWAYCHSGLEEECTLY
jgi:hypothetical protein